MPKLKLLKGDLVGVGSDETISLYCEVTNGPYPDGSFKLWVINGAWDFILRPDWVMKYQTPDGEQHTRQVKTLYTGPWPNKVSRYTSYADTIEWMNQHKSYATWWHLLYPYRVMSFFTRLKTSLVAAWWAGYGVFRMKFSEMPEPHYHRPEKDEDDDIPF
jgi:hypothetical protein